MFKFNFYLKKGKIDSKGNIPIWLDVSFNGSRIRKPLKGIKSLEKDWDNEKQRLLKNGKNENDNLSFSYNEKISEVNANLNKFQKRCINENIKLTFKQLENTVNLILLSDQNFESGPQFHFLSHKDEFLKTIRNKNTLKGYNTNFNKFKEFEEFQQREYTYNEIDLKFFDDFIYYFFDVKNYGDNYLSKVILNLKTYLTWCYDRKVHTNTTYTKFVASEKEVGIIALDDHEFFLLLNCKYKTKRLEKVRDVFIFACCTGLRISDIISLKRENIIGDFIHKQIKKTDNPIVIPLNDFAKEILEKYSDYPGGLLPFISEVKYNLYIKECCKEAGISTQTIIIKHRGGKTVELIKPKYQLITSHTARKTFATLSLFFGMPDRVVMQITNHKKDEHFRKYVKFSQNQTKSEMNTTWNKFKLINDETNSNI